jgi:hypothetical protein
MPSFNFNDYLCRRPIGRTPTGLNGSFDLNAVRSDACGRVAQ